MSAKKTKKGWLSLNFPESELPKQESPKPKKRAVKPPRKTSNVPRSFGNIEFIEVLRPKTVEELAVHPKKIEEVEKWLEFNVVNGEKLKSSPMLLLTGPSGCGKTITLRVLCKKMSIDIQEWINPIDSDLEVFAGPGQVVKFTEFIIESKYPSLFTTARKKIALIKDFPNTLINNPDEFHSILETCTSNSKVAVVFICNDVSNNKSLNLDRNLFTDAVKDKFNIHNISFNACATTLLKASLKRAQSYVEKHLDVYEVPPASLIEAIVNSCMGDLKCALNLYHIACLQGTGELPSIKVALKSAKTSQRKRKRHDTQSKISGMMKDTPLGLFHGIGRVLNPKRDDGKLRCDINGLVDEFIAHPTVFVTFLQENYLKYFGELQDVEKAADLLSLIESLLNDSWMNTERIRVVLWLCGFGLMLYNESRVSRWTQINVPKKYNKKTIYGSADNNFGQINPADLHYINIISGGDKYHTFKV